MTENLGPIKGKGNKKNMQEKSNDAPGLAENIIALKELA